MDYKEEFRDIKESIRRVEDKLDKFTSAAQTNTVDITWVKGFIKNSIALLTTAIGAIISYLLSERGG